MYCKPRINVNQNSLPKTAQYFKEELITEILTLPSQKPEMERVLDIMVWPQIEEINLVDTQKGKSNEGQFISGKKLVVKVNLKEKVTYVACEPTQSVHAAHFETLKSTFVVLPEELDGKNIEDLVRADRIQITPYIEGSKFKMLDCRNIHNCVMLFIDVKFCQ